MGLLILKVKFKIVDMGLLILKRRFKIFDIPASLDQKVG